MLSWYTCCEVIKALLILTCRFLYAQKILIAMLFVGLYFLFKYNVKFRRTIWFFFISAAYIGIMSAWCALILPLLIVRRFQFKNVLILSYLAKPVARIMGIEWEIRNKKNMPLQNRSAVVVCNHQSGLDILSMLYMVNDMKLVGTTIASDYLYWGWPFGLALHLCGVVFIKREPRLQHTRVLINEIADTICREKAKIWIYPEGRNNFGKPLPFKTGAFRIAIEKKIPIVPIVFSPHYFVDWYNLEAEKGKIIVEILPAISTKNYTLENVHLLMKKTQTIMSNRWEQLREEIESENRKNT